jgi:hypothetical protein
MQHFISPKSAALTSQRPSCGQGGGLSRSMSNCRLRSCTPAQPRPKPTVAFGSGLLTQAGHFMGKGDQHLAASL